MRVKLIIEPPEIAAEWDVRLTVVKNELGGFVEETRTVTAATSRDAQRLAMLGAILRHVDCLSVEVTGCVSVRTEHEEEDDK